MKVQRLKYKIGLVGTLITEWQDGKALCDELLESKGNITKLAKKMSGIAAHFGFDGWLVNIENVIDVSALLI